MSINGKRDGFTMEDLDTCARTAGMKRGRAKTILGEVMDAVSRWREFADEAGVTPEWRDQIQGTLRLTGF
jgi:serine/threonine-protein kinase HipA